MGFKHSHQSKKKGPGKKHEEMSNLVVIPNSEICELIGRIKGSQQYCEGNQDKKDRKKCSVFLKKGSDKLDDV